MTKKYIPKPLGATSDLKLFINYVQQELQTISDTMNENFERQSNVQNVEPSKRIEGMIRFADGVNWNPGAGRGLYIFARTTATISPVWMKL